MTKEQQDRAWAQLPADFRKEVKDKYADGKKTHKWRRVRIYESLFGRDNITSEPAISLTENKESAIVGNGTESKITEEEKETAQSLSTDESELNLCELLKGCEGVEIFNTEKGYGVIQKLNQSILEIKDSNGGIVGYIGKSVRTFPTGSILFYPSEESFKQYPLDAKRAWEEWAEERKPKPTWWRAEDGGVYYRLNMIGGKVCVTNEYHTEIDDICHNSGNYFRTSEEAQQASDLIRETLHKFHENKEKK